MNNLQEPRHQWHTMNESQSQMLKNLHPRTLQEREREREREMPQCSSLSDRFAEIRKTNNIKNKCEIISQTCEFWSLKHRSISTFW